MKVLVTGATGFVGQALIEDLVNMGYGVTALVRVLSLILPAEVAQVAGCDLKGLSSGHSLFQDTIKQVLHDVDVVIHLAARVHVMTDSSNNPLTEFRAVNHDATMALARIAAESGVNRFVFLSTIGVNGDHSSRPFSELDEVSPHNDYAVSKYEAEQDLLALAEETSMEMIIIRPPLVYGPNAPGNFASLMKWVNKAVPLPFGAIHNQRSLVGLDNLVSFIISCIDHPQAANEVFLISDGEDVSTTELLKKVAKSLGKKAWLIPIPVSWMTLAAKLIDKEAVANRLFSSLQLDSSKATNLLGWKPVTTMDEQLKKTADAYLNKSDD